MKCKIISLKLKSISQADGGAPVGGAAKAPRDMAAEFGAGGLLGRIDPRGCLDLMPSCTQHALVAIFVPVHHMPQLHNGALGSSRGVALSIYLHPQSIPSTCILSLLSL